MAKLNPGLGIGNLKNGIVCSLLYVENNIACITYIDPCDGHLINYTFIKINTKYKDVNLLISDMDENESRVYGEKLLDALVDKSSIQMAEKLVDLPRCKTVDELVEMYLLMVECTLDRPNIFGLWSKFFLKKLGFGKKLEYRF